MSTSMSKRGSLLGVAMLFSTLGLLVVARPDPAMAQACGGTAESPCSGIFLNTYYDVSEPGSKNGTGNGDNLVRLTNPLRAPVGNISACAMIYVFDANENLGECCGCPLSLDRLLSLSVQKDLTANWGASKFAPATNRAGVIDILSSNPNLLNIEGGPKCLAADGCNGSCDPTLVPKGLTPTGGLKGFITHNNLILGSSRVGPVTIFNVTPGLTEVPLADSGSPDSAEVTFLQTQCAAKVGTGSGICDCGPAGGE
jgi:hypothetical protein